MEKTGEDSVYNWKVMDSLNRNTTVLGKLHNNIPNDLLKVFNYCWAFFDYFDKG